MRRVIQAALVLTLLALPAGAATPVSEAETNSGLKVITLTITQPPMNLPVTYSYQTLDGTATAEDNDYVPTSGSVVIDSGQTTASFQVAIVGDTKFEDDEVFTVDVKNFANGPFEITIQNDDVPQITSAPATVTEGNSGTTLLNFPVTLLAAASTPVTVSYETLGDGTATPGVDFQAAKGTITFAPGETQKLIPITVFGDLLIEPNETVRINMTIVGVQSPIITMTGTILNDDVLALTVSSPSVKEGDAGTTPLVFELTLAQPSSQNVQVSYLARGLTATVGEDFVPADASVVFAPNETKKTVSVLVNGDKTFEPDETLELQVAFLGAAAIKGTGTILNDDAAPPASLTIVSGNNQQGILGIRLAQPLVVEVRDARGGAASGVAVTWRVTKGAAELSSSTSTTDAQGRASITATPSIVGSIEIQASVAGLQPVTFSVGSSTSLELRAEGPVAVPVAHVLDQICARNEQTFNAVCRALATLPDAQITPTLERVAPQPSGAQSKASSEFVSAVTSDIRNRMAALRAGADGLSVQRLSLVHNGRSIPVAMLASAFMPQATDAGAPEDDYSGWSAFLSGNLGDGERIGKNGALGFDLETRGLMFGVDRLVGQSGIVGASVNWMQLDSDLDAGAGSVETSGYALSVYASRSGLFGGGSPNRRYDGVHIDGSITLGRNTYDTEHVVDIPAMPLSVATSENDASIFAVSAGAGIEAHRGRGDFDFTLSGTWSRSDIDDLTEDGSGPLILFVQGHEIESLVATAGVNMRAAIAVPFGTLLPSFRAELVHEFESDARLVTARFLRDTLGTSFTVPVDQPDANYGKLAAGLQAEFGYGWSALIEVTQDVARSDLHFRTAQFNLRKAFR